MGIKGSPQLINCRLSDRSDEVNMTRHANSKGDGVDVTLHGQRMKVSPEVWESFQSFCQYDDWASETEKTDYTYSRFSRFRRKVEDESNLPMRPNLSRTPIRRFNSHNNHHTEFDQRKFFSESHSESLEEVENVREESEQVLVSWSTRFVQMLMSILASIMALHQLFKSAFTFGLSKVLLFPTSLRYYLTRITLTTTTITSGLWKTVSGMQMMTVIERFANSSRSFYRYTTTWSNFTPNPRGNKKYWWLCFLLLLLLFGAGWIYLSDEESSATTSMRYYFADLFSSIQHNGNSLMAAAIAFCGRTSTLIVDLFSYVFTTFHSVLVFVWLYLHSSLMLVTSTAADNFLGVPTSVYDFFWKKWDGDSFAADPTLKMTTPRNIIDKERVIFMSETADLLAKIEKIESELGEERLKNRLDLERLDSRLKEYEGTYQRNRISIDASIRRCCFRTCPQQTLPADYFSKKVKELRDLDKLGLEQVGTIDAQQIHRIVAEAIRLYDADKTGRADFAMESSGGRVVSIRCTKTYVNRANNYWLSFPLSWLVSSSPENAIRPSSAPGDCWAFQGSVGFLVLELSHSILVTGFTMDHISATLSPFNKIDSAPKHFSVWGLDDADDIYNQYLFGEYLYEDSGETVQFFPVLNPSNTSFKFVEVKIISNHGHPDYTCLYRFRVHGTVT